MYTNSLKMVSLTCTMQCVMSVVMIGRGLHSLRVFCLKMMLLLGVDSLVNEVHFCQYVMTDAFTAEASAAVAPTATAAAARRVIRPTSEAAGQGRPVDTA